MSDKVTWKKICDDMKETHPSLKKEIVYWRPHNYATILVYLKDGRKCTYNYDSKRCRYLKEKWKE